MKVLAVETAQSACSVAVRVDGATAGYAAHAADKGHAEVLLPMVAEALAMTQIGYRDLDLLAATVGPGLFTGVRVGLAAIRGLRLTLGIPAVGVGVLETLAAAARAANIAPGGVLFVVNDARRDEVYVQGFDAAGRALSDAQLYPRARAASVVPRDATVIGTGATLLGDGRRVVRGFEQADAKVVAAIAERIAGTPGFEDLGAPRPLYVRAPHARLPD